MKRIILLLFLFVIISPISVNGEFYKYVDENGNVLFTDDIGKVPEEQRPSVYQYKNGKQDNTQYSEDIPAETREPIQVFMRTMSNALRNKQFDYENFYEPEMAKGMFEIGEEMLENAPKEMLEDARKYFDQSMPEIVTAKKKGRFCMIIADTDYGRQCQLVIYEKGRWLLMPARLQDPNEYAMFDFSKKDIQDIKILESWAVLKM